MWLSERLFPWPRVKTGLELSVKLRMLFFVDIILRNLLVFSIMRQTICKKFVSRHNLIYFVSRVKLIEILRDVMITLGINKLDNHLNTKPQFIPKSSQKNNNTRETGANNIALKQGRCSVDVSCLYVITYIARWRNPQYFGLSDETWMNKARIAIITTCIDFSYKY